MAKISAFNGTATLMFDQDEEWDCQKVLFWLILNGIEIRDNGMGKLLVVIDDHIYANITIYNAIRCMSDKNMMIKGITILVPYI